VIREGEKMIAVIQRVSKAAVHVNNELVGSCAHGLLVLLGVAEGDNDDDARVLAKKIINLRIFSDENDKMNLSVKDVGGEMLVVSNFTLLANYRKGNRPDYLNSASPSEANRLYEFFTGLVREEISSVGTGMFGEHMEVSMVGDGPVTLVLDSKVLLNKN